MIIFGTGRRFISEEVRCNSNLLAVYDTYTYKPDIKFIGMYIKDPLITSAYCNYVYGADKNATDIILDSYNKWKKHIGERFWEDGWIRPTREFTENCPVFDWPYMYKIDLLGIYVFNANFIRRSITGPSTLEDIFDKYEADPEGYLLDEYYPIPEKLFEANINKNKNLDEYLDTKRKRIGDRITTSPYLNLSYMDDDDFYKNLKQYKIHGRLL